MGVVYKAEDTRLRRTVALKFLSQSALKDEEEKTRFLHEAQAAALLDHPNICTVYEIDEVEKQTFISMACIVGQSLKEKINSGELKLEEILNITTQIAEGLQAAHEKGIVHRDIKSANIMITPKVEAKIMDFGLAKLSGRTTLTKTGSTMGTVAYMSPEQARGETIDHRTDIWSLGIVLYEMITGQLPFQSDYEQAVIYSILNEDPKSILEFSDESTESLQTVVSKMLEKNPADRYQNMSEIITDLKRVKEGFAVTVKPRIKRKSRWIIPISLVVLLGIILIMLLIPHREEPIPPKIPIGVMFFDNQTGENKYDYLRKALAHMLITDLSQSRFLRVITFEAMYDLLDSLGYKDVEVIDASVGFELCQLAGAQVMVIGSLMKSGNTFVLNTEILNVNTKELIAAPYRVTGEGEGSILGNLVDDLTDKIKGGLEISLRNIQEESTDIKDLTTTSLKAYEYYFNGREAAYAMSYHSAIENFKKAVDLDSTFIEAYDALARQYYTIEENKKALEVIEKAKTFATRLPEQKLVEFLALEAYINHSWDLAINYYQRLTSLNPEDISAHLHLGMIYYQKKGMTDEGISEFEKVLELCRKGAIHYTDLTQKEIERDVSFTHNVLGWAYLRKGEVKKAHEAFEKYVSLLPNQAYPLDVLGDFYMIIGKYDQAIINFQNSLQIDPDYGLTYELLGETYLAKGMYFKALNCYEKFIAFSESEADRAKGHFYLAKLHYLKGDYEISIQECKKALELNSRMIEAHWIQGLTLVKKREFEQAESEAFTIKRLIGERKAEEPKTYYYHFLGELSLSKGLYERAIENFNKAANIKSLDRAFFLNALGKAYFETGHSDEAVEKLKEGLEINPNYAQTHYFLALVYQEKGMKEKTEEHIQKFLDIWKDADEDLTELIRARKLGK